MALEPRSSSPVHTRTIIVDAYDEGPTIVLVGTLSDERPHGDRGSHAQADVVHHMQLGVRVDAASGTIVEADASMSDFPHAECPAVTQAFERLVGLRIGPGYTKAVSALFAGPAGCTHLDHLARILGPVLIQARGSVTMRAIRLGEAEPPAEIDDYTRNSCHVWRDEGPGQEKMRLGWRAGPGTSPAPPVAAIRRAPPGLPR